MDRINRVSILPYPLNARVALRETWVESYDDDGNKIYLYKASPHEGIAWNLIRKTAGIVERTSRSIHWKSAQCMPHEAIRYHGVVIDVQVKRVQDIQSTVIHKAGFVTCHDFDKWLNHRHPGAWEANKWCAVVTLRKE